MMKSINAVFLTACALGAATTATSQTGVQTAAIEEVIQRALQEQKVVQTCGATLTQREYEMITGWWDDYAEKSVNILTENDYPAELINRFRNNAMPENIMMPGETPWSEVMAFCRENDGWYDNVRRLGIVNPFDEISKIIEGE